MIDLDSIKKKIKNDLIDLDDNYDYFLTGNPIFDAFIGSGGLPKYQLEYLWATSSVGKSTLAIQILASYIKQLKRKDYVVLYFDIEESIVKSRLHALGVPSDSNILTVKPDSIEGAYDIILAVKEAYPKAELFIIWDTLITTPSKEEVDGMIKIGMQARSYTTLFKKIKFLKDKITMIALDQHRDNVTGNKYMPEEPVACNSVKHKSFLTLQGKNKNSDLIGRDSGFIAKIKIFKSKIISPKREFEFEFTYVSGYDSPLTLISYYRNNKLMSKKNGGYYSFNDEKEKNYRLSDLYNYLLTDEAVYRWKDAITDIFDTLYPNDNKEFIAGAKKRIFDYYFKDDKIQLDRFTSISPIFSNDIEGDSHINNILDEADGLLSTDIDDEE